MENDFKQETVAENGNENTAQMNKTSLGMTENVEGLLCYLFGWVTGLIFLLAEKNSKFVKFHAIQSLLFGIVFTALYFIIDSILLVAFWYLWSIISLLTTLIALGYLGLSIYLMVKAYKNVTFKLPIIGAYAEKAANK
jgi:uncharacterized membrane protein